MSDSALDRPDFLLGLKVQGLAVFSLSAPFRRPPRSTAHLDLNLGFSKLMELVPPRSVPGLPGPVLDAVGRCRAVRLE